MKNLFLIIFVIMPSMASAQTITYMYDNVGNRIMKGVMMTLTPSESIDSIEYKEREDDLAMLLRKYIRIYPNPTKGRLAIEILGYEEADKCSLSLYTISGQQLTSVQLASSYATLDLSSRQNGLYLLRVCLNSEEQTWKVVKQ